MTFSQKPSKPSIHSFASIIASCHTRTSFLAIMYVYNIIKSWHLQCGCKWRTYTDTFCFTFIYEFVHMSKWKEWNFDCHHPAKCHTKFLTLFCICTVHIHCNSWSKSLHLVYETGISSLGICWNFNTVCFSFIILQNPLDCGKMLIFPSLFYQW